MGPLSVWLCQSLPLVLHGRLQPIYLNLKLRHGPGNENPASVQAQSETPESPADACLAGQSSNPVSGDQVVEESPPKLAVEVRKGTNKLRKVISINGEEVLASSLHDINIHDYTIFEREQYITRKFMSTIRRKDGRGQRSLSESAQTEMEKRSSFKDIAKNVMRADNVLKAMRHYHHRSDSESDSDDDDESKSHSGESSPKKKPECAPPPPSKTVSAPETSLELSPSDAETGRDIGQVKNGADVVGIDHGSDVVEDKNKQLPATNNNNNNALAARSPSPLSSSSHDGSLHVDVVNVAMINGAEPPRATAGHAPGSRPPSGGKAELRRVVSTSSGVQKTLSEEGLCTGCCVVL